MMKPVFVYLLLSPRGIFFALFLFVISSENSRHFLNQSDAKLKPIATWLPAFSRALVTCVFPRFDCVHFPALWLACLWVLSGSFRCFPWFWLAIVITLVLVWRYSIEKSSFIKAHCSFTTCNRCLKYRARKLGVGYFHWWTMKVASTKAAAVNFMIILTLNRNCGFWFAGLGLVLWVSWWGDGFVPRPVRPVSRLWLFSNYNVTWRSWRVMLTLHEGYFRTLNNSY